jgi:hypothetical protein
MGVRTPATRLGRAIRAQTDALGIPPHRERHRTTNWLRDVILGGQDGLVNILGIILGVIAADGSTTVLLVTGVAAAITESISMGAVGYTSSISERDYYEAERRRELEEIEATPDESASRSTTSTRRRASRANSSTVSSTRSPRTVNGGSRR